MAEYSFDFESNALGDLTTAMGWDSIVKTNGTSTVTVVNNRAAHGTKSLKFFQNSYAQKNLAASNTWHVRFYAYFTKYSAVNGSRIFQFGQSSGQCCDLELRTDGQMRLRTFNSSQAKGISTVPLNKWIRFEFTLFFDPLVSDFTINIFATDDDSWFADQSYEGGNDLNFRGIPQWFRLGFQGADDEMVVYYDDVALSTTAMPPPVDPTSRPPIVADGNYYAVPFGKSVSIATTVSDPENDAITYSYSIPLKTNAESAATVPSTGPATITFTPDKVGSYAIKVVVSDGTSSLSTWHAVQCFSRKYIMTPTGLKPAFPSVQVPSTTTPPVVTPPVESLPGWTIQVDEKFNTNANEGAFLAAYPTWSVPNYFTTRGGPYGANSGDHYGGDTNLSVSNGTMKMRLYRETTGNQVAIGAAPAPRLPGNTLYQLYGRYEVRFRVPTPAVVGWTAAWLTWPQSEQWPRDGELDIMEGQFASGSAHFNHHNQGATVGNDQQQFSYPVNPYDGNWHTVVCEWKPNNCAVFIDGQLVGRATTRVPNTPMRFALQTETLQSGTQPPAGPATQIVEIDSVRIWSYTP